MHAIPIGHTGIGGCPHTGIYSFVHIVAQESAYTHIEAKSIIEK